MLSRVVSTYSWGRGCCGSCSEQSRCPIVLESTTRLIRAYGRSGEARTGVSGISPISVQEYCKLTAAATGNQLPYLTGGCSTLLQLAIGASAAMAVRQAARPAQLLAYWQACTCQRHVCMYVPSNKPARQVQQFRNLPN